MGGMAQPSPVTKTTTERSPTPYESWLYNVMSNPGSATSTGLRVAARDAARAEQVNLGNQKAINQMWGRKITPADFRAMQSGSSDFYLGIPAKKAAQGGLMSVRRFAPGGKQKAKPVKLPPPPKGETAQQRSDRLMAFENAGGKLNQQQKNYVSNYAEYADKGYPIDPKTGNPIPPKLPSNATKQQKEDAYNAFTEKTGFDVNTKGKAVPNPTTSGPNAGGPTSYTQAQALYGQIAGYDPTQKGYGGITNEYGQKAIDMAMNMKMPDEYKQASDMYRSAGAGLQGAAQYTPQQVAYQNAVAERASAQQASAERASAAQMAAIRDVNADKVNLGQYNIKASQMTQPKDVEAQKLERYQMGEVAPVDTNQNLTAYQMAGPGSWTDEGVSSKYISPYMQGVIDISKREAERDYLKQAEALNAKALSAGAFGGSRQALEKTEAQRNYNQQLQDLQVKGMQQAYESGRSQYGQELGLSQQAALNNLQAKLSTQSQSSQQKLQAMLSNQNIDYQTKVQNLQAMLGVQSQEAQQMLNAALANQQTGLVTGQTNAQLAQQAALANQGVNVQGDIANQAAGLQAALANQQTQFGVGSLNANLANQVNLQNAQLGTQASMTNAQLGTQAALQNAQLGTQVNLANSQYGLQAAMANQQAGLQGNQQNIAAYGAMGNMAGGLGSIGTNIAGYNQQQLGNMAQIYNTTQGLQQSWLNQQQQNAINQMQAPYRAAGAVPGMLNIGGGGASGGQTTVQQPA